MDPRPAILQIGDVVLWQGRLCVVRGVDPMSVPERRGDVEDCSTGERLRPPFHELLPQPAAPV